MTAPVDSATGDHVTAETALTLLRAWQFRRSEVARLRLELAKAEEAERAALAALQMHDTGREQLR